VDRTRDELFSGAAFSGDQDGSVGRGNELNSLHDFAKTEAVADDVTEVVLIADLIEKTGVPGMGHGGRFRHIEIVHFALLFSRR
jgi:hypothetical protein